jgi:hypothetical protein
MTCEGSSLVPQFSSDELNSLLQRELAQGEYQSPEEVLLAGLKLLRERREFQARLAERIGSVDNGQSIDLDGDNALAEFFDAIDAEVDAELQFESDTT